MSKLVSAVTGQLSQKLDHKLSKLSNELNMHIPTGPSVGSGSSTIPTSAAPPTSAPPAFPSVPPQPFPSTPQGSSMGPVQTIASNIVSTPDPGMPVMVFEVKKFGDGGTQIIDKASQTVLYTKTVAEKHYMTGHHIAIHRGGPDDAGNLQPPFAVFEKDKIRFDQTVVPPYTGVPAYKISKFLEDGGAAKRPCIFNCGGQDYRLKIRSTWSNDVQLVVSTPKGLGPKIVLANFTLDTTTFLLGCGKSKGTIEIFPTALSTHSTSQTLLSGLIPGHHGGAGWASMNQHALLINGQPTQLMDLAIVAEHHFRATLPKDANASAADAVGQVVGAA